MVRRLGGKEQMNLKTCFGCSYLHGSEDNPECSKYDKPIEFIDTCVCPVCHGEGIIFKPNGQDDVDQDICDRCEGKGMIT